MRKCACEKMLDGSCVRGCDKQENVNVAERKTTAHAEITTIHEADDRKSQHYLNCFRMRITLLQRSWTYFFFLEMQQMF